MSQDNHSTKSSFLRRAILPTAILVVTVFASWQIVSTSPKAHRSQPKIQAQLVDTFQIQKADVQITVSGLGRVVASDEVTVYPEVSGRIEQTMGRLIAGASFKKGDLLASIDSQEYQIQVMQQEAFLAQAESELMLEKGQQKIARLEYELLGKKLDPIEKALVLRAPQLAAAQAEVNKATANLAQTKLELQRTLIPAPFDGQIVTSNISKGSLVSSNTELMSLVMTDRFQIELEIPAEQLKWLDFTDKNDNVTITSPDWKNGSRTGRLLSMSPALNESSRMAKVTIEITDPLALTEQNQGKPQVLINDLLRAEISGLTIQNALSIPDNLIRNGNKIWVLRESGTLEIVTINPAYRDSDKSILTDELKGGEHLITTYLTTPVNGLPLRSSRKPQALAGH